jgi:hypothetical protein
MSHQPVIDAAAAARLRRAAVRLAASAGALVLGSSLLWFGAAPADATSYRYWTYWSGDSGSWAFSSIGAARRPPNGGVEGWRFEVSPAATSSQPPRTEPSFASICGSTDPAAGDKRVALVIDYGTASDAPPGEHPPAAVVATCVEIDAAATGYDVLASKAVIRAQSGLVCGIGGYPATGCGDAAADPTPSASASASHSHDAGGATSGAGSSNGTEPVTSSAGTNGTAGPSSKQNAAPKPSSSASPSVQAGHASPAASDSATPVAATTGSSAAGGSSPVGALVGALVIASLAFGAWLHSRTRRTRRAP